MRLLNAATIRTLRIGSIALASGALFACGGGGSSPGATVNGTAAVGAAMANASIQLSCKNGTGTTTSDAGGAYAATFKFDGPCSITASAGAITIHSFASGSGRFNVTPLTELLLDYLAGELGTTLQGLLAGIATNPTFQSALTNSTLIANAQAGIAQLLKTKYGVTLSSSSFLTASFTPGQPGADADLDTLLALGAIGSDGQPSASLVAAAFAAGAAAANPSGGTGSTQPTGGTGSTST
jgi:hypothetical protein